MQITKKVKLQRQTVDGSVSMTLPKQIAELKNWKVKDIVYVTLDTETGTVTIHN